MCWVPAELFMGFLSGKIAEVPITDIDVVFYDPTVSIEETAAIEAQLRRSFPNFLGRFETKALMHQQQFCRGAALYKYLRCFNEVSRALYSVAARMNQGKLELMAPFWLAGYLQFSGASNTAFCPK